MIAFRAGHSSEDMRAALAPIWHFFGIQPTDEAVDNYCALIGPERMLLGEDDGEIVAGCGSFPFDLTLPGGRAFCAGLTMVGVMPTHRRRGLLSAMMRRFLDDCHARGEPLAALWASEERIYGRFGFGMASLSAAFNLPTRYAGFNAGAMEEGRFRLAKPQDALADIRSIYAHVARDRPGLFARSDDWLRRRTLADPSWMRAGGGILNAVLFEVDGAPRAYALYRINKDFAGKTATSVKEAMGVSPGATRAIWSYLSKIDWCDAIEANFLPADHSALFTFAEPRRMNWRLRDALWLRLVDVEAALKARSYFPCPPSIIEVRDEFCPWNKGRWRIGADGVTRVDKAPDMVCDADALAGVYLGGFTWREMVAAGRAQARDAFAVRMADRVFERDGAPWAPEIF